MQICLHQNHYFKATYVKRYTGTCLMLYCQVYRIYSHKLQQLVNKEAMWCNRRTFSKSQQNETKTRLAVNDHKILKYSLSV